MARADGVGDTDGFDGADGAGALQVEVVFCPRSGGADLVALSLRPGATLCQAVQASGLLSRHGLRSQDLHVGVWGRVQPLAHVLRDRDRVELYRALTVDPKEARRQRDQAQRAAGRTGARPR